MSFSAKPIAAQWALFEALCIPRHLRRTEGSEFLRSTFYAGAAAALNLVALAIEQDVSGEVAVRYLTQLNEECRRYGRDGTPA